MTRKDLEWVGAGLKGERKRWTRWECNVYKEKYQTQSWVQRWGPEWDISVGCSVVWFSI